jgi:VWFA-related protein
MNRSAWLRRTLPVSCQILICFTHSLAQQSNGPVGESLKFEVNVVRVLVPVVVRDKLGHVVRDLNKENFQVFDNDKLRPLSGFDVEENAVPDRKKSGVAPAAAPAIPERSIVLLFDDMHMSAADLALVRKAAGNALAGAMSDSDMAAVASLSGKTNSGLTRDRDKLQQAIMSLQPQTIYNPDSAECPKIDYYQADLIENKHDPEASADAVRQVLDCSPGLDVKYNYYEAQSLAEAAARRVLALGHQDIQATYASIAEFVRRVSALPGQRLLILVSPGFLPIEQEARTAESRILDLAAQSNVMISALDARGLYGTGLKANEHSPSFSTILSAGGSMQLQSEFRGSSMAIAEDAMGELAEGTGGAFFHDSNDLNAGFRSLVQAPECIYMLELAVESGKPDRTYHRLKVKVNRDGLQIQARHGYTLLQPMNSAPDLYANTADIHLNLVVLDENDDKPVLDLTPEEIAVTDGDFPIKLSNLRLVNGKGESEHLMTLLFDQSGLIEDGHTAVDSLAMSQSREIATKILRIFPESGFSFSVLDVQRRLQLEHGFTSDRKALDLAISAATQPSGVAVANEQEKALISVVRTGADLSGTAVGPKDREIDRSLFGALNNSGRISQEQHLQPSIAGLLSLLQSQPQVDGRKAVIFFTSPGGLRADSRTKAGIDSIIGAANRANAAIYVVDLSRVDRRAEQLETIEMSIDAGAKVSAADALNSSEKSLDHEATESVLQRLAEATGGSYIIAEDDFVKPVKQMIQDLTTYYEASYLPPIQEYDGAFRTVAIKPLRTGIKIRSETGYLALPASAGAATQPFELPLMKILAGTQLPKDVTFYASILHMEDMEQGSVNSLAIEAPLSALDVQEDSNTNLYSAHVSILADIKDKSGAEVAHFSEDIPRRGAASDVEKSKLEAITFQRHFIAPPGQYLLEAVILDQNSGKSGAERIPFEIPKDSGVPSLSDVVVVRKAEPFRAEDDPSEPLQHGNQKVMPNLTGQLPIGGKDVLLFFIAHSDPNASDALVLNAQVLKDGKPAEGAPMISQQIRRARFSSYLASLSIDPPKDGEYEVKVSLTQGEKTAEAHASFILSGFQPVASERRPADAGAISPVPPPPSAPGNVDISDTPIPTIVPAGRFAITFPTTAIQPLSPVELKSLLADAAQFATGYSHSLPNFVCEQVTNRSIDPHGKGRWKHADKFTELLTFFDHQESRTFLVKEHYKAKSYKDTADPAGVVSMGEFGGVLEGVFRPSSKTDFQWKETAVEGDGTVQVFDYHVARAHSILDVGAGTTTFVACHGQVFIDSATRGVRRITMVADDVPNTSRVHAVSVSVDYDYIAIRNHDYLLPVAAQVEVTHDRATRELNQIEFRNFHRFSSTSRILNDSTEAKK